MTTFLPAPTKVLIVEAETVVAEAIARNLQNQGYVITGIANSGAEAIYLSTTTQPDVVLLSIGLQSEISSIEASDRSLQAVQCPIIYLAADGDDMTLEQLKATKPSGYLVKPCNLQAVQMAIEIALQQHTGNQELLANLIRERELNQAQLELTAATLHDLKLSLSIVGGAAELLEIYGHRYQEIDRQRYCRQIQASVAQMNQLLEDYIALSQSQPIQFTCERQVLDVMQFCHDLIAEVQTLPNATSTIAFSCQGDCYLEWFDSKLLRWIVINLLSNALKYSANGSEIQFTLARQPEAIVFCIQDAGIGILPEDLDRLFEKFYRGRNVGRIQGNGLGLAIVKQCVELLDGTIQVESCINQGTTFTVSLPIVAPANS